MFAKRWPWLLALVLGACGSKKQDDGAGAPKVIDAAVVPAIAVPPLGVDAARRMNFPYGDGAAEYAKAVAAYKAKDWPAVAAACNAALAKDAMHLDAQRLLGVALAQAGDRPGAAQHLAVALAGDWLKYGPRIAADADLADFLATPEGKQLAALSKTIEDDTRKRIAAAPLVIARRSTFKWPAKSGGASTRGELYAFEADGPRFLRVTHTDDQVAAWLPSPSGAEVTVIGYDKVELPAAADGAPLLARVWIDVLDGKTLAPVGKRATIGKARAVAVGYAAGDQLVAIAYPAKGRWELGDGVAYSIDRATGKTTKIKAPAIIGGQAMVSLDDASVALPVAGVDAAWAGEPPTAGELSFGAAKKTVTVPESGKTARASLAVSPNGSRLAFVTWADPCATDGSLPSLYAFDGASGQLKHILTTASRFGARWIDDARLVYEDGEGGLRVWDAASGHEVVHVSDRAGIALRALSASPKPICKTAPPAVPVAPEDGAEVPPPTVDPVDAGAAAPGPVTAPAP
jgi:hypothetical protein